MRLVVTVLLLILLGGMPVAAQPSSCNVYWSPDGTLVLGVEDRTQTTVVDIATGDTHTFPGRPERFTFVDHSGTRMLIGEQLIDMATMTPVHTFAPETYPRMHDSGRFIKTETGIWSLDESTYVIEGRDIDMVFDLPYAYHRNMETGVVDVYNPATGVQYTLDTGFSGVMRLDFDADFERLTVTPIDSAPRTAQLYDLTTGEQIATLDTSLDEIVFTFFIPGGNYLVTSELTYRDNSRAIIGRQYSLWNADTGTLIARYPETQDLRIVGEDTIIYMMGDQWSRTLMMWQDGEQVRVSDIAGVELRSSEISRVEGERWMVMSGNAVYIWTTESLLNRQPPDHVFTVQQNAYDAKINADLTRLLTFDSVPVEITPVPPAIDATLWNLETGEIILELMPDRPDDGTFPTSEQINNFQALRSARFEGTFLMYSFTDTGEILRDAATGEVLVEGAERMRVAPGGDSAAYLHDDRLMLFETATGESRVLFTGLMCD